MALLTRFAQLPDNNGTRVFSFIVTRTVTRDPTRDVTSKVLVCGYQRWSVKFSQGNKMLGAYLVWQSPSKNLRVYVDFTFTLLNRQHFSMNEGFSGKRVKFTRETTAQGKRNYISVTDLYNRNFVDTNGEFQLELAISNVRTVYMTELNIADKTKSFKFETDYFAFGGFDWNLVVYPHGNKDAATRGEGYQRHISVYLMRYSGIHYRCRVRYTVALGEGDRRIDSGPIEDLSDVESCSFGWHPKVRWSDIAHKGVVRVSLEMIEARTICDVAIPACGPLPLLPNLCFDRDEQTWSLRADLQSDTVRLNLVYKDIHTVPQNHLKYVSWSAYLLQDEEPISLPGVPFSHYYAQEPADEGIIMETNLDTNAVKENQSLFLTENGQLRIRLEWNESHLLFQATYHKYDDVCRIHNLQMRREIVSLQADNYSLERQLFSYQKSLAYAQAQQQEQQQNQNQQHHSTPSHQAHLERSASTDTEYA